MVQREGVYSHCLGEDLHGLKLAADGRPGSDNLLQLVGVFEATARGFEARVSEQLGHSDGGGLSKCNPQYQPKDIRVKARSNWVEKDAPSVPTSQV